MQTVFDLCRPRKSVFEDTTRDDVLNLSDLIENKIDVDNFFNENFKTAGMGTLFDIAFRRFQGKTNTGVIKLTQSMGGGKTHNMLALALLAQNKKWRHELLDGQYDDIESIKVIAFSGRESDAPFGIWGSMAEQLGKKESFTDLYSPLRAPGESAWIKLLQGQNVLILMDELPPYLENAKSITIGNSDLCNVTITALANLFAAIGKEQLSNVCLVFSDLKATYQSGSALLQSSFKDLENEANRSAINIEPVALNSDEIYDILKKRLFEEFAGDDSPAVADIAVQYKEAVNRANKTGLTNYQVDAVYKGIRDSYPFHPSIKELYARFKENPNFQQTRGLIKLMRQIVRQFYESGNAKEKSLINVFDLNLNDRNMLAHIKQIKSSLEAAISHDIAQAGKSVAEIIDAQNEKGSRPYAQEVCKLLLMSSLSEAQHALNGLTDSEIMGYLCQPGIELNDYKKAFDEVKTQCWYIKPDNRGRYYFQNTKNMAAEMNTLVDSYSNESAKKELKKFLEENFRPTIKKSYENLYVLPAVDEINLDRDKVSLVIFEPYAGNNLHPDLVSFYENMPYKNRVMFLSGQRNIMEKLYQNSKNLTAITQIIESMKAEHVPSTDQQYKEAENHLHKSTQALLQTIRETFVTLYYPTKNGIVSDDFKLEFKENSFKGEEQIINVLKSGAKYEDLETSDSFMETLRKKCEQRIFTQKEMTWGQILERAGTEINWQWYHPSQIEELKKDCLKKDKWREMAGYIVKGPFDKESTEVQVDQLSYDSDKEEFTLKVRPVRGDRIYFDIGADPTTASQEIDQVVFITKEISINFICVDSSKEDPHPTGNVSRFMCKVPLRYKTRYCSEGQVLVLEAHRKYEIRYTTDGSNPKESGGVYTNEILLPKGCKFVRTVVNYKDKVVEEKDIKIQEEPEEKKINIIDNKTIAYEMHSKKKSKDTEQTYTELSSLSEYQGSSVRDFTVYISEKKNESNYVEISTAQVFYSINDLQSIIDMIRETAFKDTDSSVSFEYKVIQFSKGTDFKNWVDSNKYDLNEIMEKGVISQ